MRPLATAIMGLALAASPALALEGPMTRDAWSGLYLGAHGAYGSNEPDSLLSLLIFGEPITLPANDLEEIPERYRIHSDGFGGGVQFGVNHQIDRFVMGVETDVTYLGLEGTSIATGEATRGAPPVTSNFLSMQSQDLDWLWTFRGRIGVVPAEKLLIYGTGGLARGRVQYSTLLQFVSVGTSTYAATESDTLSGWTAGGGAEKRIGERMSVKLEYLYYDLGETTLQATLSGNPLNPFVTTTDFDHTGYLIKAGLNLRFGAPAAR